jgi:DNA-binding MarR family transcriptional regulator
MLPRIDPDTLGFLVGDLSRLIRAEIDRRIAAAGLGLTAAESRTLTHIARAGEIRQNVLAERIGVEAMTVSGALDRLQALGLVDRQTDPTDRRAKLVSVTDAADAVLAQTAEIGVEVRKMAAGQLDSQQWAELLETLKRVRANLLAARMDSTRRESEQP